MMAKYTGKEVFARVNEDIAYNTQIAVWHAQNAIAQLQAFIAEVSRDEIGGDACTSVTYGQVTSEVVSAASHAQLALGMLSARNECILAGLLEKAV